MVKPLFPIAVITFKEGIRNRAIYGISILALFMMLINFLICQMVMRDVGKVAMDIALSTVSFTGLLLVFFVGINLMAKDLDKKTIYMVLARPVSRSQYMVGKFFGMVALIVASNLIQGSFAIVSLFMLQRMYANYFLRFSWPMFFLALLFIVLMLILLTALSFLFASFSSTSFIVLVLTIVSYIIGNSLSDVKALVEAPQAVGIDPSPITVKIVQAAYYLFPNLSFFDIKTQAANGLTVALPYIGWTMLYGFAYTAVALSLACFIFSKREFP
jgi:ABC-type transport system involved in multi-copper enzyme maturation permease subunit